MYDKINYFSKEVGVITVEAVTLAGICYAVLISECERPSV